MKVYTVVVYDKEYPDVVGVFTSEVTAMAVVRRESEKYSEIEYLIVESDLLE